MISLAERNTTFRIESSVRIPISAELKIPYHHKDIALRSLSVTFKDEILEFYDLKLARIVDVIQTKVPTIEVKDRDMDINFILADNTIAHLEFESSEPTLDDQIRYGHYDLELYKHRMGSSG